MIALVFILIFNLTINNEQIKEELSMRVPFFCSKAPRLDTAFIAQILILIYSVTHRI